MADHYWHEISIGFIIIIVAVSVFLLFYKAPEEKSAEGFTEDYCISLLSKYDKQAESVKLTPIRSGAMLFKEGMASKENTITRVFLQANRYEGILEYCRLSRFSTRPLLDISYIELSCKLGKIRMIYGLTDDYNYILQEMELSREKRIEFFKDILNLTTLDQLSQETFDKELGTSELYQSSIVYVNPALRDIYSGHLDAFIDTTKLLQCSGELPSDFVELSNYKVNITVQR